MPCNIGYKTYFPIRVPQPQPQTLKQKMPAPTVDKELLEKLGVDDQEFLAWFQNLDIKPFLKVALEKSLLIELAGGVNFSISEEGNIVAESTYLSNSEKLQLEEKMNKVLSRWQMEVLKIVTQLLGYDANIQSQSTDGGETIVVVAEEFGKTHPCKYIRISKDQNGNGEITFEHFANKQELEIEKVKFAALSQKLGVKITIPSSPITGQPIPGSIEESEKQHEHGHGHHHRHSHKVKE